MSNVEHEIAITIENVEIPNIKVGKATLHFKFSAPPEFVAAAQERMLAALKPLLDTVATRDTTH